MAKSLRASTRLNAKSVIRKDVFRKVEEARELRIAKRLQDDLVNQKLEDLKRRELESEEMAEDSKAESDDSVKNDKSKVSTSGWRASRHLTYKKNQLKKNKKRSFTKF